MAGPQMTDRIDTCPLCGQLIDWVTDRTGRLTIVDAQEVTIAAPHGSQNPPAFSCGFGRSHDYRRGAVTIAVPHAVDIEGLDVVDFVWGYRLHVATCSKGLSWAC